METPQDPAPVGPLEFVDAPDGARIACKRKPNPGGTPVIFLHGLAVNADLWDVPTVRTERGVYRSLSSILHDSGADVWLVNWRGHGAPHMRSAPPAGQTDWAVDHFVLQDLPAVIDHVAAQTGRRPFVIGNSMGAMTLAGHLQGARWEGGARAGNIVADAELARRRCAQVRGCVLVEFPAALRWPKSLYDENGVIRWEALMTAWGATDSTLNYPFEFLARMGWLQAIIEAAGGVRLEWLRGKSVEAAWWRALPDPIADAFEWLNRARLDAMRRFIERYKGSAENVHAETIIQGLLPAADHMKSGVLKQMGKSVRAGAFVSVLGSPDHVYSDHYDLIDAPVLVIVGELDRIANADVTREVFFERVASPDKTFEWVEKFAHGDFEYAPEATKRVYPLIADWIEQRSGT